MKRQNSPTIGFIGAGMTGTALAVRLAHKGYSVIAVSSRSFTSAEKLAGRINGCQSYTTSQQVADAAQLVFVTTPDDVIGIIANELQWHDEQSVVHCSGAHSIDILEPAKCQGARTGCFHPLQSFASIDQAIANIPGSTFAIESEEPLSSTLKYMSAALEGQFVILNAGDKVLYHAAAVFACNYLVTLVKLATDFWQTFEVPSSQSIKAMMPLLKGTLSNIENIGLPNCLTGPIARGDLGTIIRHLGSLEKQSPELLKIYKELGQQTVPIALAKGKIDLQRAEELKTLLI